MLAFLKRRWRWIALAAVAVTVLVGAVGSFLLFYRPPDIREALAARNEWMAAQQGMDEPARERLAGQCLEIGHKYPGTVGGLLALQMAAGRGAGTAPARQALEEYVRQIETAEIEPLAKALHWGVPPWQPLAEAAPILLARAKKSPDHPRTGQLLAAVIDMTRPPEGQEPPPLFDETADLIADQFAASPDINHFCESLTHSWGGSPPWAGRYERHLRAILKVNQDRAVRCTAQFALASVAHSSPDDRQAEAEALYEQFCAEFDGQHNYHFQTIEQTYGTIAQAQLKELRFRALGKPAPEIAGVDLDDRPMSLSEHKGRVVLLNFWGTWCLPCMKLIPHERELAARFAGRPFTIVGVNCDDDLDKARDAVVRTQITWRSFRNKSGEGPAITSEWKILGYPTVYLFDHHGIIRKRWVGAPTPEELAPVTALLVDAAERRLPADEMKPAAFALPPLKPEPAAPPAAVAPQPGTGFRDKVHRGEDGSEAKYVVFVPHTYDGQAAFPAILFLHGAGSRGDGGRLPSRPGYGLAKAIRDRKEDFPFVAIFPQARDDEDWTAESAGGKRALAILNQVQKEYQIDTNRICLTGLSMGGQGTWSLAAADPRRWAAIVPICHGWKPNLAAKLKDVPCWCFHGDADKVQPVAQSREMIQALQDAGGRPLYQEFIGVDHDTCPDRAYAMPELYEWLLLQDRTKR